MLRVLRVWWGVGSRVEDVIVKIVAWILGVQMEGFILYSRKCGIPWIF